MKKIDRRSFLKAMGIMGAAAALTACGGSASSTASSTGAASSTTSSAADGAAALRFTWWGGQSRNDYTQQLLKLYESENAGITFEATPSGWDGYFEKLATDTATGAMPDLVQMDYMYIATYAGNDSLADLSSFTADGTLDVSNIDESLLSAGEIDGKLVGIPLSTSLVSFPYDKTVLAEAGVDEPTGEWTWDDFKQICLTVKEKTGKYGFDGGPVEDTNLFNYWVRSHGGKLFADDNKSLGYDDDAITADFFQLFKDLMDAGAAPNPDEYEQIATLGKEGSPIVTHDAAFHQGWNNDVTIYAAAGNTDIGLATPPQGTAKGALWYKPGMFFSVAATSQNQKAAATFINWFLNGEEANDVIMGERGTPSSSAMRDYLTNSGKLSDAQIQMFDYVTTAADYCSDTPNPDPAGISEINTAFKDIAYSVFYGQVSAADGAAEFRAQADSILAANN